MADDPFLEKSESADPVGHPVGKAPEGIGDGVGVPEGGTVRPYPAVRQAGGLQLPGQRGKILACVQAVERLLREPSSHGNWHRNEHPYAYDDFAVGTGRGCGAVAIFADGEWRTYPNWETARVLHEGNDYLEFELVYPACCALGKMTYHVTMRKGDDFFRNEVRFEHPEAMGKGWIVRPEIKEDPNCRAKPFLRFEGDGTRPCFSYEAGFTVQK